MLTSRASRNQRGQWSLIGSLVAVAILITLAAVYLPRLVKPAGTSTQDQTAIQEANGIACTEYVSQMNQAVAAYKMDHDGQPPQSLNDLTKYGVTSDMMNSPGCSFQMDPQTGAVSNGPPAGRGAAPGPYGGSPQGQGSAGQAPAAPGPNGGGTRGPGGVTIPNTPDGGGM